MSWITDLFDLLLAPLGLWGPVWLVVLSALGASVVLLILFRLVSNREAIRVARGRVTGALLAIRLYRDEPAATIRNFGAMLAAFPRYLGLTLLPLVVTLLPMMALLVHLGGRLEHRPIALGGECVVRVEVADGVDLDRLSLVDLVHLQATSPPLRIPTLREVNWRIKADPEARALVIDGSIVGHLVFALDGKRFEKEVEMGFMLHPVSTTRTAGFWSHLLHPREPRLPADLGVTRITVHHPDREFTILGWGMHWLVAWFVLVLLFAFLMKGWFGVEV